MGRVNQTLSDCIYTVFADPGTHTSDTLAADSWLLRGRQCLAQLFCLSVECGLAESDSLELALTPLTTFLLSTSKSDSKRSFCVILQYPGKALFCLYKRAISPRYTLFLIDRQSIHSHRNPYSSCDLQNSTHSLYWPVLLRSTAS